MSAPIPAYRLGAHPHAFMTRLALLNADGTAAHTFAYDTTREEAAAAIQHAGMVLHDDDTVTQGIEPPKEDGEIAASFAAAEVLADAQSALLLGRQLAAAERAYGAFDPVAVTTGSAGRGDDGGDARAILDDRIEALRIIISATPATSLQDAAVLVSESLTVASRLSESTFSPHETEEYCRRLERMLLSALPFIAGAAGLDMARMNWADRDYLRPVRFAGLGVQS